MADMTYVFGVLSTGAVVSELSVSGVSMTRKISDAGELRFVTYLDQTGIPNDVVTSATIPGLCYCIVERDRQPIWGGIVWSRTYQSQAKVLEIYCRSFEVYPQKRLIRSDFSRTGIEQRAIFCDLWNALQAVPGGNIGVTVPSGFMASVSKSVDVHAVDFKTYSQIMDQLADADDGFDWTIDVSRAGNAYVKTLRLGYPTLGASESSGSLVFEYPGSILNYWRTDGMGSSATDVYLIGAGEGDSMLQSEYHNTDMFAAGWSMFDAQVSRKDVTDQNILDGLARVEGVIRRPPGTVYKVEVKGNADPVFGSYGLGDYATLVIDDAMHTTTLQAQVSIQAWEYRPASDQNTETVILTFAGEEDADA